MCIYFYPNIAFLLYQTDAYNISLATPWEGRFLVGTTAKVKAVDLDLLLALT